ncbi:hypothetical protein BJX61DRAFT_319476 [Aspergillus egyptiacus]|nr:hypothetical protein BJX61DRAFT_319476 [Aspergillus egyptiacus]
MLSYSLRWLPTITFVFAYLTQGTHTTVVSLLDLMPKCASKCVESFITTEYPRDACAKGCDLSYLCTKNTTSGYTLGEAALRCSLSMCSMEVATSFDTYSICNSVPGALPRTHPTIVATIMSPVDSTTITTGPTIITTPTETADTGHTTEPASTKTDLSTTTFQSPISATDRTGDASNTATEQSTFTTSSDLPPSGTASETSSVSSEGSGLDSGAVIGVSVVSGVAGFFLIGVIIFFCCRKIKEKRAQDREFFEIGGHMSEPLDFNLPPKHRPRGPRPSPGSLNFDSDTVRLVPSVEPGYQHPAVIVTEPEAECGHSRLPMEDAEGVGFHTPSNLDFDAASTVSSRTVSDLLPEKPTYELYPRPLRWSQHRKRSSSGATLFEEENYTGSKNLPSPSLQAFDFTGESSRGYSRPRMPGLPANPRAMLYTFGREQTQLLPVKGPQHGKKPVYANAREILPPSRQAVIHEPSPYPSGTEYNDDIDKYWQSTGGGFVGARVINPQDATHSAHGETGRNSFGDHAGDGFEDVEVHDTLDPNIRRASRHSRSLRPLTPVREVLTPPVEVQRSSGDSSYSGNKPTRYPPEPSPELPTLPQEIVSRPRIVRQDDIKRVQIRRGKPAPNQVTVPYCPDDFWQAASTKSSTGYSRSGPSGVYKHISGGDIGRMPKKKPSPLERNLTPSRRGADLILQVE